MSDLMKFVEFSVTPHNTCRLFVHAGMLEENEQMHFLLTSLSIWGGADWSDDTHIAWEFDMDLAERLEKFAKEHNERFQRGFCEWE